MEATVASGNLNINGILIVLLYRFLGAALDDYISIPIPPTLTQQEDSEFSIKLATKVKRSNFCVRWFKLKTKYICLGKMPGTGKDGRRIAKAAIS